MPSDEKIAEARRVANEILALSPTEVSRVFHEEMKRRKLAKLIRMLDVLQAQGGEDRNIAETALSRLGFPVSAG